MQKLIRGAMLALSLSIFLSPVFASALSIGDLQAKLQVLLAQIKVLQGQSSGMVAGASTTGCPIITVRLEKGMTHSQVVVLKKFLMNEGLMAENSYTTYFGSLTETALQKWQCKKGIVCSGSPSSTGYGATGPATRVALQNCMSPSAMPAASQSTLQSVNGSTTISATADVPTATYMWTTDAWSLCTNGAKTRTVSCVSSQNQIVADTFCTGTKPTTVQSCTRVATQPVSCTFNGQPVADGQSITAYQTPTIAVGVRCVAELRTCTNGVLSGTFSYASCGTSAFSMNYPKSGYTYSGITGMFTHQSGQIWTPDSNGTPGVFSHQTVWSHEGEVAHDHEGRDPVNWNNLAMRDYEEFIRKDGWIIQSGWTLDGENQFLPIRTKSVLFYWHPNTPQQVVFDITDTFKGGPAPYALEEIPSADYAFKVEAELWDTWTNKKIYDYTDYQIWHPPATRDTVFLGPKTAIMQEEYSSVYWADGRATSTSDSIHRDHTMAVGIGYGSRIYDYANGGWVAGTKYTWQW